MSTFKRIAASSLATLFLLLTTASTTTGHVYADTISNMPISVAAICSDTESGTAQFRISNSNPNAISVKLSTQAEPIIAAYGNTAVTAPYDDIESVVFSQADLEDQTIAINPAICEAVGDANCVDGYDRANLTYNWSQSGIVTVATKDSLPLCEDVTLYLSSYTLPASYDGASVFNDSSIPQELYKSSSAILAKNTDGSTTLTTAIPNACTDYQLDLYYAPEIQTVSYHGHGSQLIYGTIYNHTSTTCDTTPVEEGGRGGGETPEPAGQLESSPTTTPTTEIPVAIAAETALANTGASTFLPSLIAGVLMFLAIAVQLRPSTRQN